MARTEGKLQDFFFLTKRGPRCNGKEGEDSIPRGGRANDEGGGGMGEEGRRDASLRDFDIVSGRIDDYTFINLYPEHREKKKRNDARARASP